MRFRRCDRCGAEYEPHEATYILTTEKLDIPRNVNLRVHFPFDLCNKCHEDFVDWFRQPKMDKAFEEVYTEVYDKVHTHENGTVTPLGLMDGRVICPVCGLGLLGADAEQYEACPSCGTPFNKGIHYVKFTKAEKENNSNEQ